MDSLNKLREAQNFIKENSIVEEENSMSIEELLRYELVSDMNDTISLFYDPLDKKCTILIDGKKNKVISEKMSPEEYLSLCRIVGIEDNNNYNSSVNLVVSGVKVRAFAITNPISKYPNITISTAKTPPEFWDQTEVETLFDSIVKDNFLIVGGSGAGKTYLMNYMLRKIHKDSNDKIGIIEEFDELFEPNSCTSKLTTPPTKPGEERLLRYITEQSNLMRLQYLYIGEIKGEEGWPFISNLSSGTKGGATMHGMSARHGLQRLQHLCLSAGKVSEKVVNEAIAKSIKYVIYVKNHKIKHIAELTGITNNNIFGMRDVFGSEEKAVPQKIVLK